MPKKNIPIFATESEEHAFWQANDSTDYLDWEKARRYTLPNLKPSTQTISLRLPESLLNNIRVMANKRDVPYQSLMKILLEEKVREERLQTIPNSPH
jgi:predicted DNA binding CopG/RHH family protein